MVTVPSGAAAAFRAIAHTRRSCKRFKPGLSIEPSILKDVLQSSMRTPTSFNLQPSQIIVVQNNDIKSKLSERSMVGAGNQYRTKDCSALIVFLADFESSARIRRIYDLEKNAGVRHPNYLAIMPLSTGFFLGEGHAATAMKQLGTSAIAAATDQPMPEIESVVSWSYKNTAMLAQSFVLGCTSHGLHTCFMEGYDPRQAKEILNIPDRYGIPMMLGIGTEYEKEVTNTPRLDIPEVAFADTFGVPYTIEDNDMPENTVA